MHAGLPAASKPPEAAGPQETAWVDYDAIADELENGRWAAQTLASYATRWDLFKAFCKAEQVSPLPASPVTVRRFVARLSITPSTKRADSPLSYSYMRQCLSAIRHYHLRAGFLTPTDDEKVSWAVQGYRRKAGTASKGKTPLREAGMARIVSCLVEPSTAALRDVALVGLACDDRVMPRPVSLARLSWPEVELDPRAGGPARVTLTAHGVERIVDLHPAADYAACPAQALRRLHAALGGPLHGPVFPPASTRSREIMTPQGIVDAVTAALRRAGMLACAVRMGGLPRLAPEHVGSAMRRLVAPCDVDLRDTALLTNQFWACARGSEMSSRQAKHRLVSDRGVAWYLERKNDQARENPWFGAPRNDDPLICPAARLEAWTVRYERLLGRPLLPDDPLFPTLSGPHRLESSLTLKAWTDRVKLAARRAGLPGDFASHSLRSGFLMTAKDAGVDALLIREAGGWSSLASMTAYDRRGDTWGPSNAAEQVVRRGREGLR